MSKISKVFAILSVISSVIGFGFVLYFAFIARSNNSVLQIGILFGLSIAVIPFCLSKSISDLDFVKSPQMILDDEKQF
jgi:hypothetical protein